MIKPTVPKPHLEKKIQEWWANFSQTNRHPQLVIKRDGMCLLCLHLEQRNSKNDGSCETLERHDSPSEVEGWEKSWRDQISCILITEEAGFYTFPAFLEARGVLSFIFLRDVSEMPVIEYSLPETRSRSPEAMKSGQPAPSPRAALRFQIDIGEVTKGPFASCAVLNKTLANGDRRQRGA